MCRCAVRMGRRAHLFGRGTHPKDSPRHRHRRVDRCARLERHAGCTRNVHRHHAAHSPSATPERHCGFCGQIEPSSLISPEHLICVLPVSAADE